MLNKEELDLNAKLQQKKNALRKELAEKGVVKKDKKNAFDKYTYFSESGYKRLFTELFSKHQLELTSKVLKVDTFEGSDKQPNGRMVEIEFTLTDIGSGYSEVSIAYGEGIDKGDKAIYKAMTGAVKYFLANTFLVATGDDAEANSPAEKSKPQYITAENKKALLEAVPEEVVNTQLQLLKVSSIDKLTVNQARKIISDYKEVSKNGTNN